MLCSVCSCSRKLRGIRLTTYCTPAFSQDIRQICNSADYTSHNTCSVTQPAAPRLVSKQLAMQGSCHRRPISSSCQMHASIAKADYYQAGCNSHRCHDSISPPYIIAVAGASASGKTSVCRKIISLLQEHHDLDHQGILCLSQDCFYRNLTAQEQEDIAEFNFDHPNAFAFDELVATLKALKQGMPADIPVYDYVTSSRLAEQRTHIEQADVILFDGILALYTEELRNLFDLKIFVDADTDTCLARRIKRDIVDRGRDVMGVLSQYEKTVKPSFESYILPTKKHADIVIPRGAENVVAIDMIYQHIKLQLTNRITTRTVQMISRQ